MGTWETLISWEGELAKDPRPHGLTTPLALGGHRAAWADAPTAVRRHLSPIAAKALGFRAGAAAKRMCAERQCVHKPSTFYVLVHQKQPMSALPRELASPGSLLNLNLLYFIIFSKFTELARVTVEFGKFAKLPISDKAVGSLLHLLNVRILV